MTPGDWLGPLERQEQEEIARFAGRLGEAAQEPPRRTAIADLRGDGPRSGPEASRSRGGWRAARTERPPASARRRQRSPVGGEAAPQGLAAGCEVEPGGAVAGDDSAGAREGRILGRPDQQAAAKPAPDAGEHLGRDRPGPRRRVEPDRAAQKETGADRPEQAPVGDLQAAEGPAGSVAHDRSVHRHTAQPQRLAVAPALLQAGPCLAEQPLPGAARDGVPVQGDHPLAVPRIGVDILSTYNCSARSCRRKSAATSFPAPRLTRWGVLAILVYLGLPLLAVLALADLLLYLAFTRLLGRCYGLLCWLG